MGKLSKVYDVTINIRGLAKQGYCRPTVKNFLLGPDDKYVPTWCGGGSPPDWFPPEDWEGYPVWPTSLGTQPDYNGPFKPKHPTIPWPSDTLGADGVVIDGGGGEGGGGVPTVNGTEVFSLRSNTTDGSTTFVDSSAANHPIATYGPVQHSTVQKYSDSSSIYFSDATYPIARLQVPASNDFNFGTGDLEISFYMWKSDYSGSSDQFVFEIYNTGYLFNIKQNTLYLKDGGIPILSADAPSVAEWHKIQIQRINTEFFLYIDGVLAASNNEWFSDFGGNLILYLGGNHLNSNKPFNGFIDDFKIIKGY